MDRVLSLLAMAIVFLGQPMVGIADAIPSGHKKVKHEPCFEDCDLLRDHRLVAAPVLGFGGVKLIQSGERFQFSSKYGTKFYLVPEDHPLPLEFDPQLFEPWTHCPPPVGQAISVSRYSTVASAVTVLRLDSVGAGCAGRCASRI